MQDNRNEDGRRVRPEWLVFAMLFVVPVATGNLSGVGIGAHSFLYDDVALPRFVGMLVLVLAAWAAWWWTAWRDREPLLVEPVWALVAALGTWAVVSALLSPHRWFTVLGQSERLEGAVTIVFYALLYGLGLQTLRRPRALRHAIEAFAVAVTLLAAYGLLQYAGLDRADYSVEGYGFSLHVAFATLGNANFLGALLVLALPCVAGLALASTGRWRIVWGLAAAVVLLGLVATLTRGAWIAGVAEVLAGAALWLRPRSHVEAARPSGGSAGRTALAAALVAVVLVAASAAILLRPDLRYSKLASASGLESRFALARVALSAAGERPLAGYGPDTFIGAFRAERHAVTGPITEPDTVNNAHSWPLQFSATLGWPGAALLVLAVGAALFAGRGFVTRAAAREDPLSAALWIACLGFAVAMLSNVAMIAYTVPFWTLLGALAASRAREVLPPVTVSAAAAVLGTLVAALALAASVSLVAADARFLASRFAYNGLVKGDAVASATAATRLDPLSVKYARGAAQARAARVRRATTSRASRETVYREFALARSSFRRALAIDPADYPSLAWLAALEANAGTYLGDARLLTDARETARMAQALDPTRTDVRALAAGDASADAQRAALAVQPLP
jgi:O-antigen ligase